ncbi:MAG TPA: acyl carrier protein [Candidatus Eisenbacteria bacterium]|nr:acyl carrier protein [Candidatus Eisenbacteria bacterium]
MPIDEPALDAAVRDYLERELRIAATDVGPDTRLVTSGLIDSVALVRLATILEERFRIAVPDRDIVVGNFDTLRLIRAYVARQAAR